MPQEPNIDLSKIEGKEEIPMPVPRRRHKRPAEKAEKKPAAKAEAEKQPAVIKTTAKENEKAK